MPTTILLYGRTGSGKSTQVGRLAEEVFVTTAKTTRLATSDSGGYDTILPYIELGLIEVVPILESDPWIFLNRVVRGYVRDDKGKWVLDAKKNANVGMYAFESAHSIAKLLKLDMERKAASGINIGGDTNTTFQATGEGENLKIGTTKGFQKFSIPQSRVWEEILASHKLDAQYVLWTAGLNKGEDDVNTAKVVGPDVIGNALTPTLPMDFNYTFRIDVLPAGAGKPERHVLYLGTHQDMNAGNATAVGNIRRPLDAPPLKETVVEPADLVKALKAVRDDAKEAAKEVIKKRVGIK